MDSFIRLSPSLVSSTHTWKSLEVKNEAERKILRENSVDTEGYRKLGD